MSNLIKIKDFMIYKDNQYNTFPSAIRLGDGTLLVAFRNAPDWQKTGKITHIDPASKAVFVSSDDDGNTWDKKLKIVYNDFIYGINDPCLNLLKDGTIFATFFMWKVFNKNDVEVLPSDRTIINAFTRNAPSGNEKTQPAFVARMDKVYTIRSGDNGVSWDLPAPIDCMKDTKIALRGNCVELENGSILAPVYSTNNAKNASQVHILKTQDRGMTWEIESMIPSLDDHDMVEPNIFKTGSGKLIAFIRTHKRDKKSVYEHDNISSSPLVTSESFDNGRTWSHPVLRSVYSPSPFHALQLNSGNVLISYGYRYKPFGLRAFILDCECENFDNTREFILRDDGAGSDTGYTSSVLLGNGDILITYYYYDNSDNIRYIAGTICREV